MSDTKLDEKGVVVACRTCRARNRIAYEKLEDQNRCGQCKSTLTAPDEPIDVRTETEFFAAIRKSAFPALVDFWAPWCGPCRIVAPELVRVAKANAGHFLVLKVNTEDHQGLAGKYRVMSIPSLALFYHGEIISRTEGARPAADIQRFLDEAVATASPR